MKVEVVGKNGFATTQAIDEYAFKKIQKVEQFFGPNVIQEARIVCKVYNDHQKVEITIPTKSLILRAEVCDQDMYAAIDKAIDKLIAQVRKHRDKVKNKLEKEGTKEVFSDPALDIDSLEKEVLASQLVRNKQVELKPMDVEEALEQMELLGHDFFIFLDKATNQVSVAYIREDGDYAVIATK